MRTSIWARPNADLRKTLVELDRAFADLHQRGHAEYDAQFAAIRKVVEKSLDLAAPPDDLAKAVAHALTAVRPKTRHHAGHGSKEAYVAARTLTDHTKDRVVAREVGLPRPEQDGTKGDRDG